MKKKFLGITVIIDGKNEVKTGRRTDVVLSSIVAYFSSFLKFSILRIVVQFWSFKLNYDCSAFLVSVLLCFFCQCSLKFLSVSKKHARCLDCSKLSSYAPFIYLFDCCIIQKMHLFWIKDILTVFTNF